MSGKLQVAFADGMPDALVEVVSPDYETVGRLWLGANRARSVEVPSEMSFLRVHLPDGRVVTLRDPAGKLKRTIRPGDLPPPAKASATRSVERVGDVTALHRDRACLAALELPRKATLGVGGLESIGAPQPTDTLPDGTSVELAAATGPVRRVPPVQPGEVRFEPTDGRDRGCELRLKGPGGRLVVQLPGILRDVYARSDRTADGVWLVSVRAATGNRPADQLLTYLTGGDLYRAVGMADWAVTAEEMVRDKHADPFAALVGAYLFLRTHKLGRLGDWVNNLAVQWPAIPDGKVLRAWQLIHEGNQDREAEIRGLLHAAAAGLPIFREGLRLLRDGLCLLGGEDDIKAADALSDRAGQGLVDAPFTAGVHDRPADATTQFRVACIGADAGG